MELPITKAKVKEFQVVMEAQEEYLDLFQEIKVKLDMEETQGEIADERILDMAEIRDNQVKPDMVDLLEETRVNLDTAGVLEVKPDMVGLLGISLEPDMAPGEGETRQEPTLTNNPN